MKKFLPHVLAKFRVRSVYFCTGREEVLSKNERRAKKKEKNKLGGNRPKFPDIPSRPPPDDFKNSPERRSSIFHPRSGKTKRRRQSCTTGSRERFLIRLRAVGQHAKHPSNFERPSANKISAACFSIFSHLFPTTTMSPCTRINDSEIGPCARYRNTPLLHEETRREEVPIVCRIFYSIRVAAFLPPRTFLRRRRYSFEPLQPSVESVYKVAWCVYREEESWNLARLEIQFSSSVRFFVRGKRSKRLKERAHERFRLDPRSSLRRNDTR